MGDIVLMKENYKNESFCTEIEDRFYYHGARKPLCGKICVFGNGWKGEHFTPKRILVIQMK